MSDNIEEDKNNEKSKMFPKGFPADEEVGDKDKNIKEVLSEYNAQKGFFKRCEEVLHIISGLFKGLMK